MSDDLKALCLEGFDGQINTKLFREWGAPVHNQQCFTAICETWGATTASTEITSVTILWIVSV